MPSSLAATPEEGAFLDISLSRLAGVVPRMDRQTAALRSTLSDTLSIAEVQAIDIRNWPDPVSAILFAAGQYAVHDAMRARRQVEPNVNQMVLDGYRAGFRAIIDG